MTSHAHPFTLYSTREGAQALADGCAALDAEWTYTVVENRAGMFLVTVHDEDGHYLGNVPTGNLIV